MAVSLFPAPSVSTSNTQFITIPDGISLRSNTIALGTGVYSIAGTSASHSTTLKLWNGSTLVTTIVTSGTTPVVLNLTTPVTKIWANSEFGAPSLQVGFTLTGITLLNTQVTGTVDIITATSTYTATNQSAYVVAIGGGGGGNGTDNGAYCGGGGGSGAVVESGPIVLNGNYSVVIGNAGSGVNIGGTGGGASGGTTSFGSLFSAGGGYYGGFGPNGGNAGGYGSATGTYTFAGGSSGCQGQNGGGGGNQNPYPVAYPPKFQWTVSGSVAGGNGGGFSGASTLGRGTNIGTGGHSAGGNASGFGCGGGGKASATGGNGSPGVVYVLKVSMDQ